MRRTKLELVLEAVDRASKPIRGVQRALKGIGKIALVGAVAGVTALTGALVGGVNEARKFESAMADVAKVADFETPEALAAMSADILDMSRHIPIAADGLATITAEAIQSGIAVEDALDFTALTSRSAVAFDMTAEAAGESFAKMRNVFRLSQDGLEDIADAVNHLSNNMAAKAPQIINFLTRAGGAADLLGLTADEMGALGGAMIALGVVPETAARGVNKFFMELASGTPDVRNAFEALDMSYESFMRLVDADPGAAFEQLFTAVGQSENGLQSLRDIVGQDFADDFLKLAKNPQLLAEAFDLMADKTDRAGSVLAEYEARAATFDNTIALFKNNLRAGAIELGNRFLPSLNEGLGSIVTVMQTLDERVTVLDKVRSGLSGLGKGLGLGGAADEVGRFERTITRVRDALFGRTYEGVDASTRAVLEAADQGMLASIGDRAEALGTRLRGTFDRLTEPLDRLRAFDWSGLFGGEGDFRSAERAMAIIEGFGNAVSGLADLGLTSLKAYFAGWLAGFAPYMEGITPRLARIRDQLGPILDRFASIFTGVGRALGLLSDNEEAMGSVSRFGRVVGDLAGQLATLSLDAVSSVLTLIDGIATVVERLVAGDIEGAIAPLQDFFDWLGSLTPVNVLPDIDAGAIVAHLRGWFTFDWRDILPEWSVADLLPDDGVLADAGRRLAGLGGRVRDFFSWGDDDKLPPEPAANDNVPVAPAMPSVAAVRAAQSDVAALSADIDRVTGAADAMPATVAAAMNQVRLAADLDLTPQGMKIMDTLAAGMAARAHAVVDQIRNVTAQVRDHLPSSPARTGPLSDLHRLKFAETIARSIRPGPMVDAMERATALTRAAANLNAPGYGGPNIVSIRRRSPAAFEPDGPAGAGGSGITVNAPLTIQGNVAFASESDKAEFEALLKRHARAVAEAVDSETRRRARRKF